MPADVCGSCERMRGWVVSEIAHPVIIEGHEEQKRRHLGAVSGSAIGGMGT